LDVLIIDQPAQLKALGHPLRVRILEMLGGEEGWQLTNRELAQSLGVDPGHLHFHVRMLLKAGLIELVERQGKGREKPYRAVARTFRVAPELLASGPGSDLHSSMLDEVQRAFASYSSEGRFRAAQLTMRLAPEKAIELVTGWIEQAREIEDPDAAQVVITMFAHPPATREDAG